MRPIRLFFLLTTLFSTLVLAQSNLVINPRVSRSARTPLSQPDLASQAKIAESYGKMPLSFEANQGQTDKRVRFLVRGNGYSLFLTANEAVLALKKKSEVRSQKLLFRRFCFQLLHS
jgi:hypothetical protein